MLFRSLPTLTLALALLSACSTVKVPDLTAYLPVGLLPAMHWDAAPQASTWTRDTLAAVAAHDADLAKTVPTDIAAFCPHYPKAGLAERRAFWAGLLSATAKHESGFNPKAMGGRGRYIGLMQISLRTAQQNQCQARTAAALKDGSANLACAVQIMAPHVATDGMVAGKGGQGIGRDWGPFRNTADRRTIADWTAQQSYCRE